MSIKYNTDTSAILKKLYPLVEESLSKPSTINNYKNSITWISAICCDFILKKIKKTKKDKKIVFQWKVLIFLRLYV